MQRRDLRPGARPGVPFEHPHTSMGTAGTTQLDTQLFRGAEIFLYLEPHLSEAEQLEDL